MGRSHQQGFFITKYPNKYEGNPTQIVYRSSWERLLFQWCDENSDVVSWGSEIIVIPYLCRTDSKMHRYFPDIKMTMKSGVILLVEVKPECQVRKPLKTKGKKGSTYLTECFNFMKNSSKWDAANDYCNKRGWKFQIWTESTLRGLGIRIMQPKVRKST